jgi:hypothetical protein
MEEEDAGRPNRQRECTFPAPILSGPPPNSEGKSGDKGGAQEHGNKGAGVVRRASGPAHCPTAWRLRQSPAISPTVASSRNEVGPRAAT